MSLKTGYLIIDFYLDGCSSLKEKRKRVSGIRQKLGNSPNIGLCESDYMDEHKRSQWSFVAVSNERKLVESLLDSIESRIEELVDARVVDVQREIV
jgi:uncharacterized protein